MNKICINVLLFILFSSLGFSFDEMLYFTGTDINVLTANEGRPEYPQIIPNIANTYNVEIEDYNKTLGEYLSETPGFYSEKSEGSASLFLRGINSGALLLFDGVPITNDLTKNYNLFDGEISLSGIKSVEVLRGASSTFWGPDAFGGIVNLKPLEGKDINGYKFVVSSNTEDLKKYTFNYGKKLSKIEYSLTGVYSNFNSYNYKDSEDINIIANAKISNFLKLEYLFIKNNRNFFYEHPDNGYLWDSNSNKKLNLVKGELFKKNNSFYIGLSSYFYNIQANLVDMTRDWRQDVSVYNIDFKFDKNLFKRRGLLSIGASYKENIIQDSTIDVRGYPPDYVGIEESIFKPLSETLSTNTHNKSIFLQYQHHFTNLEFLGSIRKDYHSLYGQFLNYSYSFMLKPNLKYNIKFSAGTAYRTPYTSFLKNKSDVDPEKINSYNLEIKYLFNERRNINIVPFYNVIKKYINEDPYGGLSQYSDFENYGLEIGYKDRIKSFDIDINATYVHTISNKENYKTLDYILILPDGSMEYYYQNFNKEIYGGPKLIGNMKLSYKKNERYMLYSNIKYVSDRQYKKLPNNDYYNFNSYVKVDCGFVMYNIFNKATLNVYINDLFNSKGSSMGQVNYVDSVGTNIGAALSFKF